MKKLKGDTIFKITTALILMVSLVLLIVPIVIMFNRSLAIRGVENYRIVAADIKVGAALFNSIFVVGLTLVITVVICSLAAYAFSKLRFRGKNLLFVCLMMGMMIPGSATLFPVFMITKKMGHGNGKKTKK